MEVLILEHKIPTLYSSIDEAMLDIDIYGRKVLSPHLSIPELRDRLFEDFKRSKPLPTLTSRRYELSRLVSDDYRILYTKELSLRANEGLIDLRKNNVREIFNFDSLEPVATSIQSMFTYESRTRDVDRDNILAKYDLFSGEEFQRGIAETEKIFNSVIEDTSLVKTDEEIEQMGKVDEPSQILYIEDDDSVSVNESELSNLEDEDDDYPEFFDEDDEETEAEDDGYYPESDDEDDDYPEFFDEDDEETEEVNETEVEDDDDYPEFYDNEDEDIEETKEVEDDDDNYPDSYNEEEDDDYPEFYDDEDEVSDASDNGSFVEETTNPAVSVDEDFSNFDMEFEEEKLELPKTPVELGVVKPVEEKIDRSAEPTDLRQFLRKYPRSSMDFVSKYFTKKQINDALRQGKIIKRGNTLRLP